MSHLVHRRKVSLRSDSLQKADLNLNIGLDETFYAPIVVYDDANDNPEDEIGSLKFSDGEIFSDIDFDDDDEIEAHAVGTSERTRE